MQANLVMTLLGPDRPGLVEAVAALVADHGGNWLESRMCRLGRQFAGLVRVSVPVDHRGPLAEALRALGTRGLTVVVHDDAPVAAGEGRRATLEVVGHDRPGIVRQIAHALAVRGINVEDLTTQVASAPMAGDLLFTAKAEVFLPADCDAAALRTALERIASDLMVDLTYREQG